MDCQCHVFYLQYMETWHSGCLDDSRQCDQMTRLFFNIWSLATEKVAKNIKNWQSRFQFLSNTKKTLDYWQRFMKFRQSVEILPNLVTLNQHSNKTFSRWTGGSDAWCQCSSSSTDDRERDAKGEASLEGWSHQRDHHLGGGSARWKLQEDQKGNLGLILQTVGHQRYCIHFNDILCNLFCCCNWLPQITSNLEAWEETIIENEPCNFQLCKGFLGQGQWWCPT